MDPLTMLLLGGGALLGGLQGLGSGGGLFGGYSQVGSASDISQINPYTSGVFDLAQNQYNSAQSMLAGYDATMPYQNFLQLAPQLAGLAQNSQFAGSQMALAQNQAADIKSQLEQQFSSGGNLFSGAFGKALGAGVATPYLNAVSNITGQQNSLLNTLYGNALGTMPGSYQYGYGLQAQQGAQAFGALQQYGAPEFYQPSYAYSPGLLGGLVQGLGAGAGMAGALPRGGGGTGRSAYPNVSPGSLYGNFFGGY